MRTWKRALALLLALTMLVPAGVTALAADAEPLRAETPLGEEAGLVPEPEEIETELAPEPVRAELAAAGDADDSSKDYPVFFTSASAPSQYESEQRNGDGAAEAAVDNRDNTYWHTHYNNHDLTDKPEYRYIQIKLENATVLTGLRYISRTDGDNGDVLGYAVAVYTGTESGDPRVEAPSNTGNASWTVDSNLPAGWTKVASGTWEGNGWKKADFVWPTGTTEQAVKYVRLYAMDDTPNDGGSGTGKYMNAAEIHLVMKECRTFSGTVVDGGNGNTGLANATVNFKLSKTFLPDGSGQTKETMTVGTATTNESGAFTISNLAKGIYDVEVLKDGYVVTEGLTVGSNGLTTEIGDENVSGKTITMSNSYAPTIKVKVQDSEGSPISNPILTLEDVNYLPISGVTFPAGEGAESDTYTCSKTDLTVGTTYRVRASAAGYAADTATVVYRTGTAIPETVITLTAPTTQEGTKHYTMTESDHPTYPDSPNGVTVSYTSGGMQLECTKGETGNNNIGEGVLYLTSDAFVNGVVEFDVTCNTITSGKTNPGMGILVRRADGDHYLFISPWDNGSYGVTGQSGAGGNDDHRSWTGNNGTMLRNAPLPNTEGVTRHVKLELNGENMTVTLDGVESVSGNVLGKQSSRPNAFDGVARKGTIGFGIGCSAATSDTYTISNLYITRTDAENPVTLTQTGPGNITMTLDDGTTLTTESNKAHAGDTVTLTAAPNEGDILRLLKVKNGDADVAVTQTDNIYTFTMPSAAVNITAAFDEPLNRTIEVKATCGGTALEGADVLLEDANWHTLATSENVSTVSGKTDSKGVYTFSVKGLAAGTYKVRVSMPGYDTKTLDVTIREEDTSTHKYPVEAALTNLANRDTWPEGTTQTIAYNMSDEANRPQLDIPTSGGDKKPEADFTTDPGKMILKFKQAERFDNLVKLLGTDVKNGTIEFDAKREGDYQYKGRFGLALRLQNDNHWIFVGQWNKDNGWATEYWYDDPGKNSDWTRGETESSISFGNGDTRHFKVQIKDNDEGGTIVTLTIDGVEILSENLTKNAQGNPTNHDVPSTAADVGFINGQHDAYDGNYYGMPCNITIDNLYIYRQDPSFAVTLADTSKIRAEIVKRDAENVALESGRSATLGDEILIKKAAALDSDATQVLTNVTVEPTDGSSGTVTVTNNNDGTFQFEMPAFPVTVTGSIETINVPAAPMNVTAKAGYGSIMLKWTPGDSDTSKYQGYKIYRAATAEGLSDLSAATPIYTADKTATGYQDDAGTNGAYYKVVPYNQAGSPTCEAVQSTGTMGWQAFLDNAVVKKDLTANPSFDGNTQVELTTDADGELDKVKNLDKGTILFVLRNDDSTSTNRSFFSKDSGIVLFKQSHTSNGNTFNRIRAKIGADDFEFAMPDAEIGTIWHSVAFASGTSYTCWYNNGTDTHVWNSNPEFDGFLTRDGIATSMTIGGGGTYNSALLDKWKGEIAYVIISEEVLPQTKLQQITGLHSISTAGSVTNGTVAPATDTVAVVDSVNKAPAGAVVTLVTTPADGYTYTEGSLKVYAASDANKEHNLLQEGETSFVMPAEDVTVTAGFTKKTYNVSFTVTESQATVKVGDSETAVTSTTVEHGSTLSFTVEPTAGYTVTSVKIGETDVESTTTEGVTTYSIANITEAKEVTITTSQAATGALAFSNAADTLTSIGDKEATFTLSAAPAAETTYKVYDAATEGSEVAGASVAVEGTTLTLTLPSAPEADGAAHSYWITATKEPNGESSRTQVTVTAYTKKTTNTLSGLSIEGVDLSPAFSAEGTSYTATVGSAVTSVTVTPTVAENSGATVKVGTTAITSENPSATVNLESPSTVITVTVTAENGTSKEYTITVTKKIVASATEPTANALTYTGAPQALVTAGTPTGGTIKYRVGMDGDFGTTVPERTNAGDYAVYYKVEATDTAYEDSAVLGPVNVTIGKGTQAAPAAGEGYTIDYAAETITASKGYEISEADTFASTLAANASVTPGGTLYVRKAATDNYNASPATTFKVADRPTLADADAFTVDYTAEKVTVKTGYGYVIDENVTAASMDGATAGNETAVAFAPGNYLHVYKDAVNTGDEKAFKSAVKDVAAPTRADTPSVPSINYADENVATLGTWEWTADTTSGSWADCAVNMGVDALGWSGDAKTVYFRVKAGEGKYASEPVSLEIPVRPDAPSLTIDTADEGVTVPTGHYYHVGGTDTAYDQINEPGKDELVKVATGAAIYIYKDAVTADDATTKAFKSKVLTLTAPGQADAPNVTVKSYENETLSTATTMQYLDTSTNTWTDCDADMNVKTEAFGWGAGAAAVTVQFRTKPGDLYASAPVTVTIPARPTAPDRSAFTITEPTDSNPNGSVTVGTAYEYKTDDTAANWTRPDTETSVEVAGGSSITIRTKATESAFASMQVVVPVAAYGKHAINVTATTNGTVTVKVGETDAHDAEQGDTVTLILAPVEGYQVGTVTVSGTTTVGVQGTDNERTFTMPDEDVTVTVKFNAISYNITKEGEDNEKGNTFTVNVNGAEGATATVGANITVVETLAAGYELTGLTWKTTSGTEEAKDILSAKSFTMPAADVTITATFTKKTYHVTTNLTSLTASGASGDVEHGTQLDITLTPADGYKLPDTITLVKMGDETLTVGTGYTYNASTGEISITSVTGAVVITAAGVQKSSNAKLSSLTVTADGTDILGGSFDADTISYTATVENSVTSVTVNATAEDAANAKVAVTGNTNLQVGANTITVTVTPEHGEAKVYTITVTRKPDKSGLQTAIDQAKTAKTGVEDIDAASESEVKKGTVYVPVSVMKALDSAISAAEAIVATEAATQEEVTKALGDLNTAKTAFEGAKKTGTKVVITITSPTEDTTVNVVAGNELTLAVTAITDPENETLTYAWTKDGVAQSITTNSITKSAAVDADKGKYVCTVSAEGAADVTVTFTVTVSAATVSATGITLSKNAVSVEKGKSDTVTATVEPSDTTDTLSATSNDTNVATAKLSGNTITITGVAKGTTTVTVTAGNISKTIDVTVTEPVVTPTDKNITAITQPDAVTVAYGTAESALGLPATVEVTLDDSSKQDLAVTWTCATAYNGNTARDYTFNGTLTLPSGVTNTGNKTVSITVTVQQQVTPPTPTTKNITAVAAQTGIEVAFGTAQVDLALPTTVEVTLSDGSKTNLAVTWSCANYNGSAAGAYTFTGALTLPSGVTNTGNKTVSITVTVQKQQVTPPTKYTVTVTGGAGGGQFEAGTSVTITANAAPEGKRFKEWTITGVDVADKTRQSVTFAMPSGNVTAQAVYEDIPSVPVTVKGYTGAYDGSAHGISVTSTVRDAVIKYGETAESCTMNTSPTKTNVADTPFTVYYQVTAPGYKTVTGSATIEITKATVTEFVLTADPTYINCAEGSDRTVRFTATANGLSTKAVEITCDSSNVSMGGMSAIVLDETAKYEFTATLKDGNFEGNPTAKCTVTVNGSDTVLQDIDPEAVTATGFEGAYDGEAKTITVTVSSVADAEVIYSATENGEYKAAQPEVVNVGEHTVYFKVIAAGYNPYSGSAVIKITKATPEVKIEANPTSLKGAGNVTLTVTAPSEGTVTVTCDQNTAELTDNGDGTFTAKLPNVTGEYIFTASYAASANYNEGTGYCAVSVTEADADTVIADDAAKVEGRTYSTTQAEAADRDAAVEAAKKLLAGLELSSDATVEVVEYVEAVAGTASSTSGTNGKLTFNVTLSKEGAESKTIENLTMTIVATAYSGGSGSSSGGRPSGSTPSGSSTVTTENPDGSTTTTVTDRKGNVTETTEKADGTVEVVETKTDGTVTATITQPDGAKIEAVTIPDEGKTITVTDNQGEVEASVSIPAVVAEPEVPFVDVPEDHWAQKAINTIHGLGLVKGVDEEAHIYDMNTPMTRGALVTVLHRFSNGKTDLDTAFDDVTEGAWYADGVAWAAKTGVVNGYNEHTFAPEDTITRQQLTVMLYRYAKLLGMDVTVDEDVDVSAFNDADQIGSWAADAMAWAYATGLVQGRGAGELAPTAEASRAEVATVLARFIDLLK